MPKNWVAAALEPLSFLWLFGWYWALVIRKLFCGMPKNSLARRTSSTPLCTKLGGVLYNIHPLRNIENRQRSHGIIKSGTMTFDAARNEQVFAKSKILKALVAKIKSCLLKDYESPSYLSAFLVRSEMPNL